MLILRAAGWGTRWEQPTDRLRDRCAGREGAWAEVGTVTVDAPTAMLDVAGAESVVGDSQGACFRATERAASELLRKG
ncbi:hypothetical protein BCY76_012970 [Nesterenkonia sp. PF2B19]|nr:hypothetical protein BCY76_012970 [Nesterenkonia sp. PF2B19]